METLFTSDFELIRPVVGESGGAVSETLTLVRTIKGLIQPLSGSKVLEYSKETYKVTDALFTAFAIDIVTTDRIRDLSDYRIYQIRAINKHQTPDKLMSYLELILELTLTPSNLDPGTTLPDYEGIIEGGNF
jgi:head-tail adaptor